MNSKIFYMTLNQEQNKNVETRFPRERSIEHPTMLIVYLFNNQLRYCVVFTGLSLRQF